MFEGTPQYVVPKPDVQGLVKIQKSTSITPETSQLFATPANKGLSTPFLRTTGKDTKSIFSSFETMGGDYIKTPYGSYQKFKVTGKVPTPSNSPKIMGNIAKQSPFNQIKSAIQNKVRIESIVDMSPARLTSEEVPVRQQLNAYNWDYDTTAFKQQFQGFPSAKTPKSPTSGIGYTPKSELGSKVFTEMSGRTTKSPSFMHLNRHKHMKQDK